MSIQLANSKKECKTVTWWPTVSSVDPPPRERFSVLGAFTHFYARQGPSPAHTTLKASLVLTKAKGLLG